MKTPSFSYIAITASMCAALWLPGQVLAQSDDNAVEVMTRGPVHEAFAAPMTLDPGPGLKVTSRPPDPVEEIPPDEKPTGDVVWVPGYWAWDEAQNDFIWISGIWRVPPPDKIWVPGYWEQTGDGWQWLSGFWADADAQQVEYFPDPPASLEQGPSSPAPSDDYFWVPGCWRWRDQYAWQAGYWAQLQPGWVWVPSYYQWTPAGCVFIGGHWDFPIDARGLLFAPVYYRQPVYLQPSYFYTPSVVVNSAAFTTHLFTFPRYHHYCFGDYYGSNFQNVGILPWYAYPGVRQRGFGYDPLFSYYRTYNRGNPNWYQDLRHQHDHYQNSPDFRPPSTYRAQQQFAQRGPRPGSNYQNVALALNLNQFVSTRSNQFERLDDNRREHFRGVGADFRNSSRQRADMENRSRQERGEPNRDTARPVQLPVTESPIARMDSFREQFQRRTGRPDAADQARDRVPEEAGRQRDRNPADAPQLGPGPSQPGAIAEQEARQRDTAERLRQRGREQTAGVPPGSGPTPGVPDTGATADRLREQRERTLEQLRTRDRDQLPTQATPTLTESLPGADNAAERTRQQRERVLDQLRSREQGQPGTPAQPGTPGNEAVEQARQRAEDQLRGRPQPGPDNAGPANPDGAADRARQQRERAIEQLRSRGQDPQALPSIPGAKAQRVSPDGDAAERARQQIEEQSRRRGQATPPNAGPNIPSPDGAADRARQQRERAMEQARTRGQDPQAAQPLPPNPGGQPGVPSGDASERARQRALEQIRNRGQEQRPNPAIPNSATAPSAPPGGDGAAQRARQQQERVMEQLRNRQQSNPADQLNRRGQSPDAGGQPDLLRQQREQLDRAQRSAAEQARQRPTPAPSVSIPGRDAPSAGGARDRGRANDALDAARRAQEEAQRKIQEAQQPKQ